MVCMRALCWVLFAQLSVNSVHVSAKFKKVWTALASFTASTIVASHAVPVHATIAPLADVGLKEFLVKDGKQFLRLMMPTGKDAYLGPIEDEGKQAQEYLEILKLRFQQVGFTNPAAWAGASTDVRLAESIINSKKSPLLSAVLSENKMKANDIMETQLTPALNSLEAAIRVKDIEGAMSSQEQAAASLASLRQLQVPSKQLPYTIPDEYAALPRLLGRAQVEIKISSPKGFRQPDASIIPEVVLTLDIDGYHAPLTSGNFIDLVDKQYYDGLMFNKIEELSVQTGLRPGQEKGYIDSQSKTLRTIPLELFYKQDSHPTYGYTSDEDQRAIETMALPFQSYGALGMARDNEQADSGSSQFFLLKWRQALIAPGRNTLDGFYSCFGYVVKNEDYLSQINPTTKIVSARVVSGMENLVRP